MPARFRQMFGYIDAANRAWPGLHVKVQAASALAVDAAALVTHDRDFSRVRSLRVIS